MNKSETVWGDETGYVKIIIEVSSDKVDANDILTQAKYCIKGLGYLDNAFGSDSE